MAPRVYIINKGPYDYSDAKRFGELVFCTTGKIDKMDFAMMYREMSDAMQDSDPADYIVLTSLSSLCSVGCAMFAAMHQRLNLLVHYAGEYVPKRLVFNNGDQSDNRGNK